MKLEDVFPTDPYKPSLRYAGYNQMPFTIQWPAKRRVGLGYGINTSVNSEDAVFERNLAFGEESMRECVARFQEQQISTFKEVSTSHYRDASTHFDFKISASVGGSVLGASGHGGIEKGTLDFQSDQNVSVKGEHIRGQIDITPLPELSKEARQLLSSSRNPMNDFRAAFGDFFVSGLVIGASNFTLISGGLKDKRQHEVERAEVDIKVLFIKKHISHYKSSASGEAEGMIRLSTYDSLSTQVEKLDAHSYESLMVLGPKAADNRDKAVSMIERTSQIVSDDFRLSTGQIVDHITIDKLCDRGLIREILLMPFSSLRSFRASVARSRAIQ